MALSKPVKDRECRLLMVGKSGSGKSSTANNIMGEDMFPVSTGLAAGTKSCEVRKSSKPQKGVTFRIVDTPGLFDPKRSNEEIAEEIIKAAANLHPGLHALLYVLKTDRYTPEEQETFFRLKKMYDENILKYVIIIFTGGDVLKKKKMSLQTLLEDADEPFKEVLRECGNRVLVFNNTKHKPNQTKLLLEMVDKIHKDNGEMPYSCSLQTEVSTKLERRVTIRTQERIERDPVLQKKFAKLTEDSTNAKEKADDQHKQVKDIESKKEMTELMIARKLEAKQMEEQRMREKEEKEKQESAEKERKERDEKEKQERAGREQKNLEEKRRREEEEEERKRKRKEEKKAEVNRERRQREREIEELRKERAKLQMELEMKKKLEKEQEKMQKEMEEKLEKERKRYEMEEMEKTKLDIAENSKEKHWVADVTVGLWKGAKGWFGY